MLLHRSYCMQSRGAPTPGPNETPPYPTTSSHRGGDTVVRTVSHIAHWHACPGGASIPSVRALRSGQLRSPHWDARRAQGGVREPVSLPRAPAAARRLCPCLLHGTARRGAARCNVPRTPGLEAQQRARDGVRRCVSAVELSHPGPSYSPWCRGERPSYVTACGVIAVVGTDPRVARRGAPAHGQSSWATSASASSSSRRSTACY